MLWVMKSRVRLNFGAFLAKHIKNLIYKSGKRYSCGHWVTIYAQEMDMEEQLSETSQ